MGFELLDGAGSEGITGGGDDAAAVLEGRCAILAAVVVFPVPFTPTSMITTGRSPASMKPSTVASKSQ